MGRKKIGLAILAFLLLGYGVGQIVPYSRLPSLSSVIASVSGGPTQKSNGQPANTVNTAVPYNYVLSQYTQNQAAADSKYTGKTLYISGLVGDVQKNQNGRYYSCVAPAVTCPEDYLSYINGLTIWYWQNGSVASSVPIGRTFIAECSVGGLQNGNLVLNNCIVANG